MLLYKRANALIFAGELDAAADDIEAGERLYPAFVGYDYARGLLARERGDHAAALAHLQTFLRANPQDAAGNLYAGAAALEMGNLEQAREYLSQHLAAAPGSRMGTLLLASVQANQGNLEEAEATLQPFLNPDNPDPTVIRTLALIKDKRGSADEAVRLYRQYVALAPDDADGRVRFARLLAARGDLAGSDRQLDAALDVSPGNLPALLQRVSNAIAEGDVKQARERALAVVEQHPESPYAFSSYAAALAADGDLLQARAQLEKALELNPAFEDAALKLARMALMEGDFAQARAYYEDLLRHVPDNTTALLSLAQLDVNDGAPEAAMQRLRAALARQPAAVDLRLNLVNGLGNAGRLAEARQLLQEAPPAIADDPRILAAAAAYDLALGQPYNALSRVQKLVELTPQSAGAHYLLARTLLATDASGVEKALIEGFRLDPDHPDAGATLTEVFEAAGDAGQESLLQGLRRVQPGHPRTRLLEVRRLQLTGDDARAISLLEGLHRREPDNATYFDALFRAQVRAGQRAAAIKTGEGWLAAHAGDVATRVRVAQLYAEEGRTDDAVAAYEDALQRQPGNAAVLNNLAMLLTPERPAEAAEMARRAHQAAPDNPAIADTLGVALLAVGDADGAREALAQAHRSLGSNATVTLHYAQALLATGERDAARRLLLGIATTAFDGSDEVARLLEELR
jgi:putative PEP-CTERM system TPR-repeat lipoprotein